MELQKSMDAAIIALDSLTGYKIELEQALLAPNSHKADSLREAIKRRLAAE